MSNSVNKQHFSSEELFPDRLNNSNHMEKAEDVIEMKTHLENGEKALWNYEEILEEIGFHRIQWILLLISGLMTITSMAAQTSIGIIAIASQCEFHTTQSEKGIMMAACVAGIVLTTYFWGYICDVWGRRQLLFWSMMATTLFQVITMFVTNVWLFNFINLLMGIGLGGLSGSLYPYLSEFNTVKYRPIVINYSTMFVSIAAIYVPATAWLVLSANWSFTITESFVFKPWRLIILFNLLPGLIGTLMLIPFPESPKFLLIQQNQKDAIEAINWISKSNRGIDINTLLNVTELKLKPEMMTESEPLMAAEGSYCQILLNIWKATKPLFVKPYVVNFVIAVVAMFGMFLSSNGMQIWYPEIVNRLSLGSQSKNESHSVCEILVESFHRDNSSINMEMNTTDQLLDTCDDFISTKTYIDNMIMGFAFLVGFSIQGTLLNPLGRKNVLLAALAVGILSGFLLHFVTNSVGVLVLFCLYILLPGLSISIMCGAIVDLVPTQLRGKAVSFGMTLGRLGVIVASNMIAALLEPYCNTTFGIITGSLVVCGILVHFLPI